LKFHSCNNISNSEENSIVRGKILRLVRLSRVCFCPATRERLLTPDLDREKAEKLVKIYQLYRAEEDNHLNLLKLFDFLFSFFHVLQILSLFVLFD